MRVCIVSSYVPSHIGGIETYVRELSSFLASAGVGVTVFGKYHRDFFEEHGKIRVIGIRMPKNYLTEKFRFTSSDYLLSEFKFWKAIKQEDFDIFHGNAGCFFPELFGKKIPFVQTFHGTAAGILSGSKVKLRSYQEFLAMLPDSILTKRYDAAVAVSQKVKNELVTLCGVDPKTVKVIYSGVDTGKFRIQDKNNARRKMGLPSGKYGLWIGQDPIRKSLGMAIKTVRGLDDVRLLVVGVAGESDAKIIYFGQVDEDTKIPLYNCAEFLLFPTLDEGFGLVTLEAMACGLPIIISKECPAKEIIDEGIHGFVVADKKPESYREKIAMLLKDDVEYKKMSTSCRKLAEKYSWGNQGKEYLTLYKRLL